MQVEWVPDLSPYPSGPLGPFLEPVRHCHISPTEQAAVFVIIGGSFQFTLNLLQLFRFTKAIGPGETRFFIFIRSTVILVKIISCWPGRCSLMYLWCFLPFFQNTSIQLLRSRKQHKWEHLWWSHCVFWVRQTSHFGDVNHCVSIFSYAFFQWFHLTTIQNRSQYCNYDQNSATEDSKIKVTNSKKCFWRSLNLKFVSK